ncbi:hypothetical protein [Ruegeria sp. HKCCA4633]|uniref:hypothetical protein n=1 Tax=Ruegeria sp. HKCCA4633 TaxID=2682983 RepID=UPI0014888B60|nr:hypothetical protein [Ruegeria sp. HKCCA4633]
MKPTSYDVHRTRNSWTADVTGHGTLPVFHKQYIKPGTPMTYLHASRVAPALFAKQVAALQATGKCIFQIDAPDSHASNGYVGQTNGRNNAYVFNVTDVVVDGLDISFTVTGRA